MTPDNQGGKDLVTVGVSHPVDPEQEEEFLAWQRRVTDSERAFPGFRGCELLRPVPGAQGNWTAIFRFDTEENLDAWLDSPERRELLKRGSELPGVRTASQCQLVWQLVPARR